MLWRLFMGTVGSLVSCVCVCVCAVDMWRPLGCADSERFALVWESEELKALNNTLFSFIKNKVSTTKLLCSYPNAIATLPM